MAVSPDQEERRAIAKDPAKYNPRNPWPRVEQYAESLRNRPQIVLPTEEETQFANLPVEEYGNVKANRDRWAAAEELASALASRRESEQKEFQYSPGMPYPEYDTLQDKNFVEIARKKLDDANARVLEFSERLQNPKPLKDYPTLASALMQAPDLTEADVRRVVNFAAAWTASDAIMSAPDMQSQWNIFLSLPEIQQLVVWDIWQERVKEIQDEAEREQAEAEMAALRRREEASPLELAAMDLGGSALTFGSAALSALDVGYQTVQQYARAVATGTSRRRAAGEKAEISFLKAATIDPFFIWDEVAAGTWNNRTLEEARTEYGDALVDIVVEVQDLANEGDPSPISTLQAKYYSDPEKARILRLLTERQFKDSELLAEQQEILSAADKILSAQASDLGKIITTTNPLTGAPIGVDTWWRGSQPQKALSATTNVAATFMLDPFIIGGKVRGVYLGAKYGLERIAIDAGEKTVTAALSKPAVNAYLIDLTSDLKKYDDLVKAGKDTSQLGQVIANRYKNYFPEDVLFTMSKEGVHSPEALIKYVNDTNRMLAIERGQVIASDLTPDQKAKAIANIEDKSVFGRMARQQMAKRGQPLLPRNSILWTSHLRRQLSDALSVGARRKSAREEVRAFYKDANNPNLPAGAILFNDPTAVANFDEKITSGWDRLTRWAAQTTGRDVIYTADARDTQVFRRFARLFMSSNHADYLADRWRNGTQGDRILMWIGVVRAAAERRGASEIADKTRNLGTRVINNKSSLTVQEITDQLTFAKSPASLFAPESLAIGDTGRTVDDWIQSKVDEFIATQKINPVLSQQIDTIYSDIFDEANRIAAAEGKTLSQMSLGQGDDLAAKILDARAKVLLEDNPELLGKGIFESPTGLNIHNSSPAVRKAYMEKFYPNVKPDTKITIYRGVQEGEVPGVSLGTTGPAGGRVEPGGAAWWTTNPYVAQRLAETQGRKIATLTVSWDELQKIDPNFVPGPRAGGFGLDDEVMVDYTSDAFKSVQSRVSMSERIEGIPSAVPIQENALSGLQRIISQFSKSKQQLDSEVDGYRAALLTSDPEAIDISKNAIRTSPANFGDQQLALHLWQTSDYLAVPNLSDLELITKRSKLANAIIGATPDSVVNNAVNWWSLINLAGFRYSVRNATEDYTMYALTGGYFKDIITGRVMSTATRETRGLEVGGRPNIGFIARRMRTMFGREAGPDYDPYSVWDNVILPRLNKDEVAAAKEAMDAGDLSKFRELLTVAVVRQKLGRTLTKEERRYLNEYVLSDESFLQLDDLVELSQGLNLGTMPSAKFSGQGFTASMGNRVVWPRSSFVSLDMKGGEPFKYAYWHRGLEGVLVRDGAIGKIAVANLDDPQVAIKAVAEAIEADTKYRYKDRLAAFYEMNVSTEEFAARYVQDVLNMFSRRDGSFNKNLWSKFVFRGPDGTRRASWNMKVDGEFVPIVSLDDLSKIDAENAPRYVLGKGGGGDPIEIPSSVSERIWDAMGNAFARIGKEPIYFANYVRSRKGLSKYENQLAEAVGPKAASIAATRVAQDRALALTLAFTDNPKNRSMLAYRLRNYARYYRAQEDFYRRVYRAVKYEPLSVYKAYLTIGVLDETGFIYEDSYGEKYFLYPGDGLINNVMARAMAYGGGDKDGLYFGDTPLTFGGKIKMWAPSFDLSAAVPMLSSPISTLGIKTVMNLVPQFQKYEDNILGDYAVGKPTPEAALPGPFVRFLGLFDQDERYSMYAGAWMGAARVLAGAGLLPDEGASEEEIGKSWDGIASIANQILLLRFALGFVYPAIPQIMENNVTTYARQYGYDGMTSVYRELVDKAIENGDPDPYATAMLQGVSIYGLNFTAYNVGKTQQGAELKSLPEYSYDSKLLDFKENNGKLINDYPSAAMFLGPVRTENDVYDPASRRWLMDNGYRVPPSIEELKTEFRLAEALYVYQVTMDDADDAILAATTPEEVEKAEQDKKAAKALVYATYNDVGLSEYFQTAAAQKQSYADRMLNGTRDENGVTTGQSEVRRMVKDFYDGKYGDTVPKSVEKIAEAIATYDLFTASSKEIVGRKRAEVNARRENRFKLLANLQAIAEEDDNAEMFIRRVMYPLLDARPDGTPR